MTAPDTFARLTAVLADRYTIARELGAGGMATVYLARDLKHDRDVAIKVLHPDLGAALGGERFLSEIRTTARLQHPHILPLIDSGDADGLLYYVMPLVTGETLRARLERETQLPIPDAVRIAREIASALDYAHRQGVIHRDIKPENILLHDGQAIVADFGIALAVQSAGGARMTQTGLSLGTPQYMSPEQAMGERVIDARSDVYALGTVTYEMLTGDAPFTGSSVQAIVAKVLSSEAERPSLIRKTVPANVEAAVLTALAKLPADRFASAAEFSAALTASGVTATTIVAAPARRSRAGFAWLAAGLGVGVATVLGWNLTRSTPSAPPVRLDLTVGPVPPNDGDVAISPDGTMLAYAGQVGGQRSQIYLRHLDGADPNFRVVPGSDSGLNPDFSPDGKWIVFVRLGQGLAKVSVSGGSVSPLVETVAQRPHWGADSQVVYTGFGGENRTGAEGTWIISSPGGRPARIPGLGGLRPFLLPDGSGVLGDRGDDIWLHDLKSDSTVLLIRRGFQPIYVSTGRILYVSLDGGLYAVPFDLRRHTISGTPVRVLERVGASSRSRGYAVSSNGTMVQHDASFGTISSEKHRLVLQRFAGGADTLPLSSGRRYVPRISPDGKRVAFAKPSGSRGDATDIFTYELATRTQTQITFDGSSDNPVWSPNGSELLFVRAGTELRVKSADNSGADRLLLSGKGALVPSSWSTDDVIAFSAKDASGDRDGQLMTMSVKPGATPQRYEGRGGNQSGLTRSPDGTLAAFSHSEADGGSDIWIREYPTPVSTWRATPTGGQYPRWSRDGNYVYFWKPGTPLDTLLRVRVDRTPGVVVRPPEVMTIIDAMGIRNWDLHPDGKSFIVTVAGAAPSAAADTGATRAAPRYIVVLNWFTELKALMQGAGKP